MAKCFYCGKEYSEHKGVILITNKGEAHNLCSSKCRKNMKLGRDKRKVNWIRKEKKSKKKE